MIKIQYIFVLIIIFIFNAEKSLSASESPQSFTFQGRLFNAAGTDLLEEPVSLRLQIYDPSGSCLLYQETQSVDLTNSSGSFSVSVGAAIGAAKRTAGIDPSLSMATVFKNDPLVQTRAVDGVTCPSGYTPTVGDTRLLRVTVTPFSTGIPEVLSPDQTINSVPHAIVAETLQGLGSSDFVKKDVVYVTNANVDKLFGSLVNGVVDASALHHHDGRYVQAGSSTAQDLGSGGFNTSGKGSVGSSTNFVNTTLSVKPADDNNVGLAIRAYTGSQSADLFQVQNNLGEVLTKITASGNMDVSGDINASGSIKVSGANTTQTYTVRVATTANITLSGTQTIDFISVGVGDRVLVKNQSNSSENGVYVVASGAWNRSTDIDTWEETIGYTVQTREGGYSAGMTFTSATTVTGTLGTTSIAWNAAGVEVNANNTAFGYLALNANSSGMNNAAFGSNALAKNQSGIDNAAFGTSALAASNSAFNAAFGAYALYNNTSGGSNVANGRSALHYNTTGSNNVAVGGWALMNSNAKSESTAIGYNSMYYADSGSTSSVSYNTALGAYSLRGSTASIANTGVRNTAIGHSALYANTTGSGNTATGQGALLSNTSGSNNIATGYQALISNTSGNFNTASGYSAMSANTTGWQNTATGYMALSSNTTGYTNTAMGAFAASTNRGKQGITSVGYQSMYYADPTTVGSASFNTAIGVYSLRGSTTASSNTGVQNTALGHSALLEMTSGSGNVGIGYNSGSAITSGSNNVVIGSNSGVTIATTSNNILIADGAGNERILVDSLGQVGIGTSAPGTKLQVDGIISSTLDNTYSLGTSALRFTDVYAVSGVVNTSDARQKRDIQDSDLGLNFIINLRPVSYVWRDGPDKNLHYGLIAQETEKVIKRSSIRNSGIVTYDEKSDRYGVRYSELIAPLIKAVQEVYTSSQAVIDDISLLKSNDASKDREIASLKNDNKKLKQENEAVKSWICDQDTKSSFCK
ncbi:MAG: tail fiber domain-containing protein [Bacteriovoracaceae bacterium]|nr:tail fiber domain-containing protein [Bacteriovoracaceae bacterium]